MVQVDALISERLGDLFVLNPPVVEGVEGAVVLVGRRGDGQLRVGHHLHLLSALFEDLLEVDGDPAALNVLVLAGVVDEDRQLLRPTVTCMF